MGSRECDQRAGIKVQGLELERFNLIGSGGQSQSLGVRIKKIIARYVELFYMIYVHV